MGKIIVCSYTEGKSDIDLVVLFSEAESHTEVYSEVRTHIKNVSLKEAGFFTLVSHDADVYTIGVYGKSLTLNASIDQRMIQLSTLHANHVYGSVVLVSNKQLLKDSYPIDGSTIMEFDDSLRFFSSKAPTTVSRFISSLS